ncbi:MAG: hypothetical protein P8Y18_03905 [Candidatus Bathyarchaeota archaeon]
MQNVIFILQMIITMVIVVLDSKAVTKIKTIILLSIIIVAGIGIAIIYFVLNDKQNQSSETVKIGICADLDSSAGKRSIKRQF